jgi:hypothetical protein
VDFATLGFTGPVRMRDVWERQDFHMPHTTYTTTVPGHGVVLLRVSK